MSHSKRELVGLAPLSCLIVVVGSALPANVKVYEIPNYPNRYAYVNGRTVLVEPGTNKIVYVYR